MARRHHPPTQSLSPFPREVAQGIAFSAESGKPSSGRQPRRPRTAAALADAEKRRRRKNKTAAMGLMSGQWHCYKNTAEVINGILERRRIRPLARALPPRRASGCARRSPISSAAGIGVAWPRHGHAVNPSKVWLPSRMKRRRRTGRHRYQSTVRGRLQTERPFGKRRKTAAIRSVSPQDRERLLVRN